MENQTTQKPEGKKLAIAGFVISLVALVFYLIIAGIVALQAALGGGYGLGIFWLILSLVGTALCVFGMTKLGKTGGKKGLAIAGIIVGIIALVLSIKLVTSISDIQKTGADLGNEFKSGIEQGLNDMADTAKLNEEINTALNNMTDSLSSH